MRQAEIYQKEILAGILTEDGGEYRFCYDEAYLAHEDAQPVSLRKHGDRHLIHRYARV